MPSNPKITPLIIAFNRCCILKKIKTAIVGLGRLGKEYAYNLRYKIPQAQLVAACSLDDTELNFARQQLGLTYVFSDYQRMIDEMDLEAIFVVSSTNKHAEHIIAALKSGLHVFSEKPLAITSEDCKRVEEVAANYPRQLAVVGFVRRFDPSYRYAKEKIDGGAIGTPYLIKSQTVDKDLLDKWQMAYVTKSGGIFHDYSVHDIDLARWLLDSEIARVWSVGGAYKHPGFAEAGDADNVLTTCVMKNGTMAVLSASRTAMHGHDTFTEIVGTEGVLKIGRPAANNLVELYDVRGIKKDFMETFWDRFEQAFLLMATDFIDCVATGRKSEMTLENATQATIAATVFTKSFQTGKMIKVL